MVYLCQQTTKAVCLLQMLDESGRCEFHGTAITLTSHLKHDKIRKDPPPLKLDFPEGEHMQLGIGNVIVSHFDEYAGEDTLLSIPTVDQSWCRVIWRIVAPRYASGRRIKFSRNERNICRQLWVLPHSATRRYQTKVNGWDFPIFNEKAPSMQK